MAIYDFEGARGKSVGRLLFLLVSLAMLAGCAGTPARQEQSSQAPAVAPSPPKTLRMATIREPVDGVVLFSGSGDITKQFNWIFHAGLTTSDAQNNLQPRLARKVPTVEDGDWRVLPDGSMEVTWRLRPNVKWHDGTTLHAEDFVFGIQVAKDPQLPLPRTGGVGLIKEVVAPDAETLVVRWSETFNAANVGTPAEMPALPRHLIGDLYRQGDPDRFTNSNFWTRDWIGVGPYRMGDWAAGSHTEAFAFDDYFLGRPKIDRLLIRYITDTNAIVANLLSGDIDVMTNLRPDDLSPVKSAWHSTGEGTVLETMTDFVGARLSYRDLNAPWVQDKRIRHALLHGIDRQVLADTFSPGTQPPDVIASPEDPVYRLAAQRGIPRFPYDMARAERLMGEAGWRRGPDGGFQNAAGERFSLEVRVVANAPVNVRRGEAIADLWKRSGFGSELFPIPSQSRDRQELKALSPGAYVQPDTMTPDLFEMFRSSQIATPENRWQGRNLLAYVNPEFDRRHHDFLSSLEVTRSQSAYADLLRWFADEMVFLPLYYDAGTSTTAFRRGIRGPGHVTPVQVVMTWNLHEWEMS